MSRITPGTMIVLIFAVLFGLVGAYAVRRHFERPVAPAATADAPAPTKRLYVPLASARLEEGRPLTLSDITIYAGTREQIKNRKLGTGYMVDPKQVVGRILREPLEKGAPFRPEQFYPEGMGPSVAERLRPGLRAVTVSIEGSGAINGLAPPGSRVDVLFRTDDDQPATSTTVTLLEDIEVLAIDRNVVAGSQVHPDLATVTLAVSSEQANALKIADNRGTFSLALRHPDDGTLAVSTGPRTLEELLDLPEQRTDFHAEIYRGQTRQEMSFPREPGYRRRAAKMPISGLKRPATDPARRPGDALRAAEYPESETIEVKTEVTAPTAARAR